MAPFINNVEISDSLIERPIGFSIGDRHFSLYQPTLGKNQLTARLVEIIGLVGESVSKDILSAALAGASEKRDACLRLVAYATLPGDSCLDEELVRERMDDLSEADDEDIASLLVTILTMDKTATIANQLKIDAENKKMKKVLRIKEKDTSTLTFGGKTIWGTLIDAACERYGWTYQYVLWGVSYSNLQLLLADQVKSIYLTDEERKKCRALTDSVVIKANDVDRLNSFIRTQNWK